MQKEMLLSLFMLSGVLFFSISCTSAKSTQDIKAVENFQLERYLGTWYEIARLPHFFEKGMDYVSATYSLGEDNTVKVINRGIKNGKEKSITGVAHARKDPTIGALEVSFFRPFWADYRIIYLSQDYRISIVTSSDRDYLWILSKDRTIPEVKLAPLLGKIKEWEFDSSKLYFPKQNENDPSTQSEIQPQ